MSEMTPEEERRILEAPPKGTWVLMLLLALALLAGWALMYFARFLSHGPVS